MPAWVVRIGIQVIRDPERALKIALIVLITVMLLVMFLFAAPIAFFTFLPVGSSQDEYDYYTQGANRIRVETTIDVNWQHIMAIDAVILNQNFKKSSAERAYGYKEYFVREETETVKKTCTDTKGKEYDCSYTKTNYFARDFEETLQMLVADGKLKSDQLQEVRDKVTFAIESSGGKVSFKGGGVSGPGDIGIFQPVEGAMGWPTDKNQTTITSPFGYRIDPITGAESIFHKGTDIAVPIGTPVYAARDGKVIIARYSSSAGNYVGIDHGDGMVTKYMHCDSLVTKQGAQVKAGQLIAKSGNTGASTGPHLHFQIEISGKPVDAMQYYR
ncbi:M23 family metallopeptidase [Paenibacillus alvei]|uniref:M23 family metallopeptidase n=1 Tax=Paenibacillus alvei TaxID=44250 RepID=UPI000289DE99|nr:M23 family metallopeptidase [Paenibacillus alvei]EJW13865.1 putative metalloprotease YebA [Paenibacillus alvei DSM 29]MCY9544992.1 M23 family metallopeptidase [Paenibacillus alvei]MCY9708323.1 M23 family metallopeptidase [Paenibacillus alvei]MCY9732989.1 M23 family metallopeptidase [Paenibacillus alvei]MCY9755245.1 M23 family metallopeptidase [Paenibacillus alvei]